MGLRAVGISTNRINGDWTGVSMARFVRLAALVREAGASDAGRRLAVPVFLRLVWERAESKACILAFLDAVARADGAVAVHCREGLGRTGTLAAAHLMVAHGFSAREAMGWVRIMRPGSIVGEQQRFLCRLGDALAERARDVPAATPVLSAGVIDAVESLVESEDDGDDDATVPVYDAPACQPAPRASSLTRRSGPAPLHPSGGPMPRCSSEEPLERRRRERKRPQSSF
jgi:hypothetical protein